MARVKERYGARRCDGRGSSREYFIDQATSDDDARSAMLAFADCPPEICVGGVNYVLDPNSCGVEEIHTASTDGTTVSSGMWIGQASWQSPQFTAFQPVGNFKLSFDISGQSSRILFSRQTISKKAAPGFAQKDYKGAINVQHDFSVEGVDISVPYFTYTLTKTFDNAVIAGGWVLRAARVVGSVNNAAYQGFAEGELLLSRVSGQQRPERPTSPWDVTFGFAVSFNETGLTVGEMTGIDKQGWDYLWAFFEPFTDPVTNCTHPKPTNAFVERVYRRTDYSLLGI